MAECSSFGILPKGQTANLQTGPSAFGLYSGTAARRVSQPAFNLKMQCQEKEFIFLKVWVGEMKSWGLGGGEAVAWNEKPNFGSR